MRSLQMKFLFSIHISFSQNANAFVTLIYGHKCVCIFYCGFQGESFPLAGSGAAPQHDTTPQQSQRAYIISRIKRISRPGRIFESRMQHLYIKPIVL